MPQDGCVTTSPGHASDGPNAEGMGGAPDSLPARVVIRAQLGDRAALQAMLVWTRPWLARCLRAMLPAHDAEDAVQEVMLIVARRVGLLDEPRAYRAWVYRIATRHALRVLAKRRRVATLDSETPVAAREAAEPDREELERLRAEVSKLTPNSLAVIVLHYFEGLSIARVSGVLGVPEGTVKSRLNTALAALRRSVRSEDR